MIVGLLGFIFILFFFLVAMLMCDLLFFYRF